MAAPAVIALGEVMLRLSPDPGERLETARSLRVHPGGAEANVTAALARLGVPCAFVSALPESPLGHRIAGELRAAGVSLAWMQWIAGARIGTYYVDQAPPSGPRATDVLYDRAESAFARAIRWPADALAGARYAVVSGITPALSPQARTAARELARDARAHGVALCVDVNYRSRLWPVAAARTELAPLLAAADIVVCSAVDAAQVLEIDPDDPVALRERWSPGAGICVITQAQRGAIATARGDEGVVRADGVPTVPVDRLGLGDAFLAGLLFGLLEDWTLERALTAGTMLAALKATVAGDFSLTRRADLLQALGDGDPVPAGTVRR